MKVELGVDILFLECNLFYKKAYDASRTIYKTIQNIISLQYLKKNVITIGPNFLSFFDSISKKFKVKHFILLEWI